MEAPVYWDLSSLFPALESPEFDTAFQDVLHGIQELGDLFDRYDVRRRVSMPAGETLAYGGLVDARWAALYDDVTLRLNTLREQMRTVSSFLGCLVTTDARNDLARAKDSELDSRAAFFSHLYTRYEGWVGSSDVDTLCLLSEVARAHEFHVRRCRALVVHQMPEGEESLAAELRTSGVSAWAKLHGTLTALLTAVVSKDGQEQTLPMSSVRSLAGDADRDVRRRAFESELRAWESVETPIAAALNGVKGFQSTLRRRRAWDDDVAPTLLANNLDRQILDVMQAACIEAFPDFRRYLGSKAKMLRLEHLAWYDLGAPVGDLNTRWTWRDAEEFIVSNFGEYSERMGNFASEAFRLRWVDATSRVGKEGGAYCTGVRPGESRVMMNFDGTFNSVSTLAHELGHAYHNLNMRERTSLQRITPSAMAETASIFCETLVYGAAMRSASPAERLALLDTSLQKDLMIVVDIHSRFLFEKAVFERRVERDLSVREMKELMLGSQRETYGPDIDPLHPYMWAVKGHYYGPCFYNYPYTFGLLFGLGLYTRFEKDPASFREKYDSLLSCTGIGSALSLAQRFGIEIHDIEFWRSSLDIVRGQIVEFEELARKACRD